MIDIIVNTDADNQYQGSCIADLAAPEEGAVTPLSLELPAGRHSIEVGDGVNTILGDNGSLTYTTDLGTTTNLGTDVGLVKVSPNDLTIETAEEPVSGVWSGRWNGVQPTTLAIEHIDGTMAQVVYAWGPAPAGGWQWRRPRGRTARWSARSSSLERDRCSTRASSTCGRGLRTVSRIRATPAASSTATTPARRTSGSTSTSADCTWAMPRPCVP